MNDPDRLYELLPVIYRKRDASQGYPLKALLRVIAEQVDVVEDDIAQLYENWFVETCEDWVVPYIGDLVGYRPVNEAGKSGDPRLARSRALNKILIPRREIANTIAYRRRKGTLALLELLANNVAGWPARAVEFYKLLGWMQHLDHQRSGRGRTVDLRCADSLATLDGPFNRFAHTVDVHRVQSNGSPGRYNIPSVGVFVWRLRSYSVSRTKAGASAWKSHAGWTPACCVEDVGPYCYTFSVLGNDTPLFNRPQSETDPTHIAGELNLPTPIRREALEEKIIVDGNIDHSEASADYYGSGKSLVIWAPGWPRKDAPQPVPREKIIPANLSRWRYRAPHDHIAVDPERGRILFPTGRLPKQGVLVHYHYAFSADIGGGEYDRPLSQPAQHKVYRVGKDVEFGTINGALEHWTQEQPKPQAAVIEITDSAVYTEPLSVALAEGEFLQIRAANRTRPIIRLLDYMADRPDFFNISGANGSRVTLDGLLVTGRGLKISGPEYDLENPDQQDPGDLCDVTIRHCTLVPGWALHSNCEPRRCAEPSLEVVGTRAHLRIERSIVGAVQVIDGAFGATGPVPLTISDSIWDSTSEHAVVLGGAESAMAYVRLNIARSTVLGRICAHQIDLAENCIFTGPVRVARTQTGCVRFCYVPEGSRTPRRYECQPDLVRQAIRDDLELTSAAKSAAIERESLRVRPQFNSIRYGMPTYCQLTETCAEEIKRGADDESEMGVFHDLFQPQREANLRARLYEYTPAGMDAGIIHAT